MIRTILIGSAAAAGTFVVSAIVFAILDLYLSGHALPSPMKESFVSDGPFQMSVADAIALSLSAVMGVLVMVLYTRMRAKSK